MDKKKPVCFSLTNKDKRKADALAAAMGINRSDMVRHLIRSKRKPKALKSQIEKQATRKSQKRSFLENLANGR